MGRWSVAWRVLDAQFWGTSDKPLPQRRRRIALVADFGGLSASEILFVRQSVSGNLEPGEQKRKETPRDAGEGTGGAVPPDGQCAVFNGANITSPINKTNTKPGDPCHTLTDDNRNWLVQPTAYSIENHPADSRVDIDESGKVQTLTSRMGTGGGNVPMVMESVTYPSEKYLFENHSQDARVKGPLDVAPIVSATFGMGGNNTPLVMETATFADVASTLRSGAGAPKHESDFVGRLVAQHSIVRRLTPLECERLQGFPDGWTDIGEWVDSKGKKHKEADSPRYKALGNSIALPPWKWVLKRLCACYERDATMASLFDGIGGFPYIWEQLNGKGSCLWASEIEEFPMAVTKLRFGG